MHMYVYINSSESCCTSIELLGRNDNYVFHQPHMHAYICTQHDTFASPPLLLPLVLRWQLLIIEFQLCN